MNQDVALDVMFLLFICASCLAGFWQLRADYWKQRWLTYGQSFFRSAAKDYFDRLTDEEILRAVPPEYFHARLMAQFMLMEKGMRKKFNP